MREIIDFLSFISFYPDYFVLFMFFGGIYFVIIAPIIFKVWIIPSIERKYGVSIRIEEENVIFPFSNWGLPAMEISLYVFYQYIGHVPWKKRSPPNFTLMHKLLKTNYNIDRAGRAEIFVIAMSFIIFVGMLVSVAVFCVYLLSKKH